VAAAIAAYVVLWPSPVRLLTTGIGETKTVQLEDRSRLEIDADSRVSLEFTRNRRLVHLLHGQAYFQVAKDPARPFMVESHGRFVVATGTAFDVETMDRGLHVTLVEGHVVVRTAPSGPVLARLEPGDSLTTELGTPDRLEHRSNLLAILAWRTGHLMFDDVALSDAIARMGHYVHQRIDLDPSVASLRISGVFAAGDMNGLLEAVESYYPVAETRESDGGIRLTRRS
jgi:transmembrane sensor